MPSSPQGQPVTVSTEVRLAPVPPATVGVLTNAGTILLRLRKPDGTFQADYTGGSVVNDSTGKYHVDIPGADLNTLGLYRWAWFTTGTAAGCTPRAGIINVIDAYAPAHISYEDAKPRLNITAAYDPEIQAFIDAAVATQEELVGPIAPRTVVENADLYYGGLKLPTRPVISITSATLGGVTVSTAAWTVTPSGLVNLGTTAATFGYGSGFWSAPSQRYVVTYRVGQQPVPQDLIEAGLLRVQHAAATQRGGGGGGQVIGSASSDVALAGVDSSDFLLILRAQDLERPYLLGPGVA